MGLGTDTAKQLLTITTDRAEIAAAVDALNEALHAIDTAEPAALARLKATHAAAFEASLAFEVAERVMAVARKHTKPIEAEPVKAR